MKKKFFVLSLTLLLSTNIHSVKKTPGVWSALDSATTSASSTLTVPTMTQAITDPTPAEASLLIAKRSTTSSAHSTGQRINSSTWVEDSDQKVKNPTFRMWSAVDADIKHMLTDSEVQKLMEEDRARAARKTLRALELTSRELNTNNPEKLWSLQENTDRQWYEDATMHGVDHINQNRIVVSPDEAKELATRLEQMQFRYEKELSGIIYKMLNRISLLRRAGDIVIASADGHPNLQQLKEKTLNRRHVSTPALLIQTMYQHGFFAETNTASSSKED